MDYTKSLDHETHADTGNTYHESSKAQPTVWSGKDANSIIWSLMEILKEGGGTPLQFDKDIPNTYRQLLYSIKNIAQVGNTTGQVSYFATPTAPTGWLKANGALVSRTAYAKLFDAIGTTYGEGDGITTFKLPDLRGEFLRGWDDGRGIDQGRAFGSAQSSQNLAHAHGQNTGAIGDHGHSTSTTTNGWHGHNAWTDAQGEHTHTEQLHNQVPVYVAVGNAGGGQTIYYQNVGTVNTGAAGNHAHNVGIGGSGEHSHIVTIGGAGAHSHTIASDGGNEARPRNVALLACIKY